MRIAVNTRILLKGRLEGVGWFTREVLQRLVRRHPGWEFLFLFDRPYDEAFVFGPNVQPLVVAPPARHPLLWAWWFNVAVPRVLRQEKADVFFSPDGHCSLRTAVPTVMVTHDIAHEHFPEQVPWLARRYYEYFIPRYLRRADRLITVSEFSKRDIIRHFDLDPGKISVCGNGARPEFHPLPEQEKSAVRQQYSGGQDYFFYLGSVNPRKNVRRLIEAFDVFKNESRAPVKLLIGGRFGWLTGEVKEACDRARHREDIVFLGYLPEAELPGLMGAALALTYVSLFEGFGLPILEALHAEVPVITSDTSSMPEVAGEAALLVDPFHGPAIARAMTRIYRDAALRRQLVEAGRRQRRLFSWEKTTGIVENVLMNAGGY